MSFMGSMLGSIAGRAAVPVMGAASFGAYKSGALEGINIPGMATAPSHYEMQARVTDIEVACNLRFRVDGKLRQTEALDCSRVVELMKRPEFVGYTLHKSEKVTYQYYSMDGKSTLVGAIKQATDSDGRRYQQNDVIDIRVNAKNPSKSEVI